MNRFRRFLVATAACAWALAASLPLNTTQNRLSAQEPAPGGAWSTIAPLLDEQTLAVIRIDVKRIAPAALGGLLAPLAETSGWAATDVKQIVAEGERLQKAWDAAGGGELYIALSLTDAPRSPAIAFGVVRDGGKPEAVAQLLEALRWEAREVIGNVVVTGSKAAIARVKQNRAVPHADLSAALSLVAASPVQIAVQLPADMRRVVTELGPKLPAELNIGTSAELAAAFRWLAVGVDMPPTYSFRVVLQADSPQGAQLWQKAAQVGLKLAAAQSVIRQAVPNAEVVAQRLKPELRDARLEVRLNNDDTTAVLRDSLSGPLAAARQAAARTTSTNNLKQIALAMHNYHDTHRRFPAAASRGANGKPLLSWRVHLLPFLDQTALYEKFKLDEPWDSAHNKQLITPMPQLFVAPGNERLAATGKTVYVVPVGEKAVFADKDGMSIAKITDGTSNTIMAVQVPASRAVTWTQPADWEYDVKNVLDRLIDEGQSGFLAALCDGSVRFIAKSIAPATLLKLLQANDGQVVEPF